MSDTLQMKFLQNIQKSFSRMRSISMKRNSLLIQTLEPKNA